MDPHYSLFLEQKCFLCYYVLEVCNFKAFSFFIFIFRGIHTSKLDFILIGDFKLCFIIFYSYMFIFNVCLCVHIHDRGGCVLCIAQVRGQFT